MNVFVKVGPKGQVVIPKVFRDEYGIVPGSEVAFAERDHELVISKTQKAEELLSFLRQVAAKHRNKLKNFRYSSHEAYDEEMRERFKNSLGVRRLIGVR